MRMDHHTYDLHKSCAGSKFQRIPMFCLCIRQASHIALKIKIIRFFGFLHHPSKFLGILWLVQVMWTSFFTINRHRVSEQFLRMWFWNVPRPAFLSLTNLIFRFATLQGCKFAFGCGDCGKTVILVCPELFFVSFCSFMYFQMLFGTFHPKIFQADLVDSSCLQDNPSALSTSSWTTNLSGWDPPRRLSESQWNWFGKTLNIKSHLTFANIY